MSGLDGYWFLIISLAVLSCTLTILKRLYLLDNGHIHMSPFFSFGEDRDCGGVAIMISRSFINECLLCFSINIVPGRILCVVLTFSCLL